jgi:hypothetical protein
MDVFCFIGLKINVLLIHFITDKPVIMATRTPLINPEVIIKDTVEEIKTSNEITSKIIEGVKKNQFDEIKTKFVKTNLIKTRVTSAKAVLSKIPETIKNSPHFAKDNDDIAKKNKEVIENNLAKKVKESFKTVRVTLSPEEFDDLKRRFIDQNIKIPQDVFDDFLLKNSSGSFSFTNETQHISDLDSSLSEPDLELPKPLDDHSNNSGESNSEGNNSLGNAPVTQDDILKKVNDLIDKLKSPEFVPELLGNEIKKAAEEVNMDNNDDTFKNKRATQEDIDAQIKTMRLESSPADEPAFYDFYSLQIAFEHVWKELFDDEVEKGLNDLYQNLVELDVPEAELPVINPQKPLEATQMLFGAIRLTQQEPNASVLKSFSISDDIWNALSAAQQTQLANISNAIVEINNRLSEIGEAYESLFDGRASRIIAPVEIVSAGLGYQEGNRVIPIISGGVPAILRTSVNAGDLTGKVTSAQVISSGIYKRLPGAPESEVVNVSGASGSGLRIRIHFSNDFSFDTIEETRTLYIKAKSYFNDQQLTLPLRAEGENIIAYGLEKLKNKKTQYLGLHEILQKLEKKLKEKYAFTIFAANEKQRSINFGLVINYRQKWTPVCYQAGKMVKSIPLSPGEEITYSKKITKKLSQSLKETSSASEKRSLETTDNTKAEADIMSKAYKKVNSNVSAKASYSGMTWSFGAEASYAKESSNESADNRKDFREAVVKAAQEYKNERSVEINTSDSSEFEAQETGKIKNPNDEITVTYLFYELQQRYSICETLNRITPVVLIAEEVPNPCDIDNAWLIANAFPIRKALLDESLLPALYYLTNKIVGDEIALDELKRNMEIHREILRKTNVEYISIKESLGSRYAALEKSTQRRIEAVDERRESGLEKLIEDAMEQEDISETVEVTKLREEAAKDEYDKAARDEREARASLDREITAMEAATKTYTDALSEHLNHQTQVEQLRLHVVDKILYYMQVIWSFEPPDQRFLRLYKLQVPDIKGEKKYTFIKQAEPQYPDLTTNSYIFKAEFEPLPLEYESDETANESYIRKSLVELADLDTLLGFKGNYLIFPMKENNAITDYMMTPFLNRYSGLSEQDTTADWTLKDYENYVQFLKNEAMKSAEAKDHYENVLKPELYKLYKKIITKSLRQNEEIVVPTGSLFIEALPGKHPILEDFKLMHRAIDVKKVQAEVRYAELENLRSAARLLSNKFDDPKIDKKIVVEGTDRINVNET